MQRSDEPAPRGTAIADELAARFAEREAGQSPGAIQPHGLLLAVDASDGRILQISENAAALIGRDAASLLHERWEEALGVAATAGIEARLGGQLSDVNPVAVSITLDGVERRFDAIVHRNGNLLIVELEPNPASTYDELEASFSWVSSAVARIQAATRVEEAVEMLASEVRRLTGFERVAVYRFEREWHADVVAESRAGAMESLLGLRFPASDVPRRARELFRRSSLRLIPNAGALPARILPPVNPLTDAPLDLTDAVLRSASPSQLQYLQNMGVAASMSASLLKRGELWGLVVCHHRTPYFVPFRVRVACELLARTAALQLTALDDAEEFEYRDRLRSLQPALVDAVTKDGGFTDAIAGQALLGIADAEGAAIKTEGEPLLVGVTPRTRDVRRILTWLGDRDGAESDEPFATDCLPLMNPEFADIKERACGLLAIPLTTTRGGWLLWFRPEVVRTVVWGGDPAPAEASDGRVAPPRSFEKWNETVTNCARPWLAAQMDAAVELRRLLSDVMMRRAGEYAKINAELARSNQELESFAHIASHDLKEPLRGVHHYAEFILADYAERLDERGKEMLAAIVQLTRRMEGQIASILELSRVGEEGAAARKTDLDVALDEALELLRPRLEQTGTKVTRKDDLPAVVIGAARAREIFVNLVGNAMKYNDKLEKRIEIGIAPAGALQRQRMRGGMGPHPTAGMTTIYVRDNGIGIREKHYEAVFRMFKRLHAREAYGGGTGAGLAIVRKIVEQQGGTIWVESELGEGSTFYVALPTVEEED